MAVSVNYPTPVWVNGFQCRNCSDVDLAKKHIDPAHPKSGPFDVDARSDPTRPPERSVKFGGQLSDISDRPRAASSLNASGSLLDLSA